MTTKDYKKATQVLRTIREGFMMEEFRRCKQYPGYMLLRYSAIKFEHEGPGLLVRYVPPPVITPKDNMSFPR